MPSPALRAGPGMVLPAVLPVALQERDCSPGFIYPRGAVATSCTRGNIARRTRRQLGEGKHVAGNAQLHFLSGLFPHVSLHEEHAL